MSRHAAQVARGLLAGVWCLACIQSGSPPQAQTPTPATAAAPTSASTPAPLTDAQMEEFLLKGRVGRTHGAGKGITGSLRAPLTYGNVTHEAHIQTIDESKREFKGTQGTEFNFRDYWGYNIAGYKIDRLLGLGLVPVSVERRHRSEMAAFTWWLDDVMMDEAARLNKKMSVPADDLERWNQQMQMVRLFDQLIANVDRNLGNLIITNTWNIWMIDHTRAFRTNKELKTPGNIARCDRQVFARLKQLDKDTLRQAVGPLLTGYEIDAVLARRDAIVALIEQQGESGLFDRNW